jgi:hypothetical protein
MAMDWVRWSWKFVACAKNKPVVPRASGCMTSSRLDGERAMRAPVRRVASAEVVRASGGADQPRTQFFRDAVHEPGRSQVVDDDGAVRLDRLGHRLWRRRGWKMRYGHRRPSVIAPSP